MGLQKYIRYTLRKVKQYSENIAPINTLSESNSVNGQMLRTIMDVANCYSDIAKGLDERMSCCRKMNDSIALDVIQIIRAIIFQYCENTKSKS